MQLPLCARPNETNLIVRRQGQNRAAAVDGRVPVGCGAGQHRAVHQAGAHANPKPDERGRHRLHTRRAVSVAVAPFCDAVGESYELSDGSCASARGGGMEVPHL